MLPEGSDAIDVVLQSTAEARDSSRVCYPKMEVDKEACVRRVWMKGQGQVISPFCYVCMYVCMCGVLTAFVER